MSLYCLCVGGFVVDYISHPVINSFTTAAAITIACSQLKVSLSLSHCRSCHRFTQSFSLICSLYESYHRYPDKEHPQMHKEFLRHFTHRELVTNIYLTMNVIPTAIQQNPYRSTDLDTGKEREKKKEFASQQFWMVLQGNPGN